MTASSADDPSPDPAPVDGAADDAIAAPVDGATDDAIADPADDAGGRFSAITGRVDKVRSGALEQVDKAEDRWPVVAVGRAFVTRYLDVNGVVLSGHLAFRCFSFLFPLALVAVALAGLAANFGYDAGETATDHLRLGEALGSSIRQAGSEASAAPYHVAAVALLGLVLGAMGMLSGLNYVFALAWRMKERKVVGRLAKVWRLIVAFFVLAIVLLGSSAVRQSGFVVGVFGTIGVAVAFFFAFVGLGLIMPRRCDHWYWLLPGGIVGGVGLLGLQIFANVYLPDHLASLSKTYGALAIAVVLLSYLFLIGQVVVASALASAVWYDHCHPEEAAALEAGRAPLVP